MKYVPLSFDDNGLIDPVEDSIPTEDLQAAQSAIEKELTKREGE